MIITTHSQTRTKPFATAFYVVSILLLFAIVMRSIHADTTVAPSVPIHDLMKKIHEDRVVKSALEEKLKKEPTTTVVDTHIQPDDITITTKPTQQPVGKPVVSDDTEQHKNNNLPTEQTNDNSSALSTHFHNFVSNLPKTSAFHNFSLWDQPYSADPLDDDDLLGMLPDGDADHRPHAFVSSTHFSMLRDPKKRRVIMRSVDIEAYNKDHYEKTTTYQVCYPRRAARDEKLVVKEQVIREDHTTDKNDVTSNDDHHNNNTANDTNNNNNAIKRGIWYFQGPQVVKKQVDSGFKLAPFTAHILQPFPFIFAPGPLLT